MASDRRRLRIERLLDEADAAVGRYDWEAVRAAAQAVLAFDPENGEALDLLTGAERALDGSARPPTGQHTGSSQTPTPRATPDHPTSFANGRYQVQKILGEGGKKKVYLARDTTLDREVAFALIKTEGLNDTSRTRIQREAQAMGRLGSHPHIVTVFDLGQEADQPYMVTELMSGGDVEGIIEEADDHRVALDQAINIAVETCRGLEFAHGRGIIHRDLKPGNVWLTVDGVAKIGDFGLAVSLDRSRLTTEGMMVGTVSYMPPEQAMGGEVTPRSDLYSLGAMLYEMITGRPPFLGDDSVAIIGQHINTPPVAPTWHNGQCPRPLEALIMRLLAKNPSERPQSAADVLSALEAIDLADAVGAILESPLQDGGHSLDSLAGGVFVGRQREMGELKACLEDALSGRGRLVTLVGEPGIGKTRTALELATYAGLRQAQVLWGRCYEGEGAPPYWPWVQAIRSYVRDVDPEQLRSEMGAGAADIGQVVSDVGDRLPGLKTPPQLEPEQARFRLFDSITAFLKSAGRRQPLVLVLDDLHWADHPSLLLLEFVAKELGNARLMVIGTYRDVELSRQHPLSKSLGELTRSAAGGFQRVLLRGLDQGDVGRFVELVSGITPPAGMVEAVHRQTEGNPLFVTEVVRLLVQEGHLAGDGGRGGSRTAPTGRESDSWSVRIPEGVREVIGRRLDRLSDRCNETLTIASVVGREFTLEQLSPLIEDPSAGSGQAMTEARLLDVMDEALSARVVEELPRAVGRYQFTHALIQETLADELSLTRRVRLHARIAETLEEMYGDQAESHAAQLAHHFSQAEAVVGSEKLVRYSLLAGERALAAYANEEAVEHFERALAAKEDQPPSMSSGQAMDAETAALLFGLGRAQTATIPVYEMHHAVASLSRAFDYYVESGDVARAVAIVEYPQEIAETISGMDELGRLIARALELVPADSREAGGVLARQAKVLGALRNDYEGAQEAMGRALAIARRDKDGVLEARILSSAIQVATFHLHYQDALEMCMRAIELGQSLDDLNAEVNGHVYAPFILIAWGEPDRASRHAEACLSVAEKLRDRYWLAFAFVANQLPAQAVGDWKVARDLSDRGLSANSNFYYLLACRASLEYQVGDFGLGEEYLERLLEVARPVGLEAQVVEMTVSVASRITGVAGRSDVARRYAETVLSSPDALPYFIVGARLGLVLLAVQAGDATAAEEQYAALGDHCGMMDLAGTICIDRVLGLLAHTMGKFDDAEAHFEDALAFCRKAGYRPELAWSLCDYADTLLHPSTSSGRAVSENRAKASALLDESLAISSELGMRPLMERVLSRREILGA